MPLLAPFPWLMARWEKLGHDPAPQPSKTEPPTSGGLSAMPTDENSAFPVHTVEEVMSQMEVRRAQLARSAWKSAENVWMSVRGGQCGRTADNVVVIFT